MQRLLPEVSLPLLVFLAAVPPQRVGELLPGLGKNSKLLYSDDLASWHRAPRPLLRQGTIYPIHETLDGSTIGAGESDDGNESRDAILR